MRCHYMSDLHLESEGFDWRLPTGDILIVAGDLCHARCLDPGRPDKYSIDQRTRVMRFAAFHDLAETDPADRAAPARSVGVNRVGT